MTPNISAWPNDAAAGCSLSQVLEQGSIPQRYFLSAKALAGIARRDGKRGQFILLSRRKGGGALDDREAYILEDAGIRRASVIEWERCQGFPDDYTQIPWRNKSAGDCPDGPRYKALGNSKAVTVVRWIGRRLLQQL